MDAFASSAQYNISNAINMHIHIPTTGEKHELFKNSKGHKQEVTHKELIEIAKNHPIVTPMPIGAAYHKHRDEEQEKLSSEIQGKEDYSFQVDHAHSRRHDEDNRYR